MDVEHFKSIQINFMPNRVISGIIYTSVFSGNYSNFSFNSDPTDIHV